MGCVAKVGVCFLRLVVFLGGWVFEISCRDSPTTNFLGGQRQPTSTRQSSNNVFLELNFKKKGIGHKENLVFDSRIMYMPVYRTTCITILGLLYSCVANACSESRLVRI